MNVCDSDVLSEALLSYGASKVNSISDADVVILNTCAVRAQAEQKAFSFLGRVEEFKKEQNPDLKIIVIGCMAERLGSKIKKRFNKINAVIGAKEIDNAVQKILKISDISNKRKEEKNKPSEIIRYVTIMRGCDNYCSYCVVPYVRGKEISLNYENIVDECKTMVENGAREIMLLGQNVNSYKYEDVDFAKLIEKIANIPDLQRIRFMTNHPKDLNDSLIDIMSNEPKICGHIHLPIQSASNNVLKNMNRKYTYEHYVELIRKLRTKIPDISITTDLIVGFPGETEEDFQTTLKAIKDIRFGGLYVFKYSTRPGTKAASLKDDVPLAEKKRRHAIILEESNKISMELVAEMVGTKQQVLAEKLENGILEARTRGGRKVLVKGDKSHIGKHINVLINEVKFNSLYGDII